MWTKLCFLAPLALTSSASDKNEGDILADPEWKDALFSSIGEAVAKAYGAEIDASTIHDSRHLACNDAEFDAQGFDRRPRARA
jgi:hypothetical protein